MDGENIQSQDATPMIGGVDWLTGLPDMSRFNKLARDFADNARAAGQEPVAVALDLVGMKSFNAQYGRAEGDWLLCVFADELRNFFGEDACSRFAEDHYYAFANRADLEETITDLFLHFPQTNDGKVLPVRVGAYVLQPGEDMVEVGLDRAKLACDMDRKSWQSHLNWFTDGMRRAAELRIYVLEHVDMAIGQGWIRPEYQGIVRTSTGDLCGEEALARWNDPVHGQLAPIDFIPVLEEAGLLYKVDLHIVDCVLADMRAKWDQGVAVVPVSVNISQRDLRRMNLAEELTVRADMAGVPHELLHVEFTESAAMTDPIEFKRQADALHEAGFEVWMDDFGSGYSSLNSLQEYDFDLIKLDMGFISGNTTQKSRDIVAGVIQIAHRMGVCTLAEGVETERQALFLAEAGCDMLQGFHYTRPLGLQVVMDHFLGGESFPRERVDEVDYWSAVGAVDLAEPAITNGSLIMDDSPLADLPAGVCERRNGEWRILRSNSPYREFLDKSGMVPGAGPSMRAEPLQSAPDEEFEKAADLSKESHAWERVGGRLEYGTGLQFYVRFIASVEGADAFAVTAIPTQLGSALGVYGDVPVAYAVFRVVLNDAGDQVIDAEYIFANELYRKWGGYGTTDITGRSFLEVNDNATTEWFPHCYRAAVLGEEVHDLMYSPEVGRKLSFHAAPSKVEGCCIFAFAVAGDR